MRYVLFAQPNPFFVHISKMLPIINLIMIILIIISIVVNMMILYKARAELYRRVEAVQTNMNRINPTGGKISMVDTAEFEKLSPEVKELYRKYIINNVLPKVMGEVNTRLKLSDIESMGNKLATMSTEEIMAQYGPPM